MTLPPAAIQMDPDADARHVQAARNGDRAALSALIQTHQGRLYHMALRMLGNPDDALEATQEALLKACRALNGFEGRSRFGTWVAGILMNEARTCLRRRKVRLSTSLDTPANTASQPLSRRLPDTRELDPLTRVETHEATTRLLMALDTLSQAHKTVLILSDMDGMSHADIAEALDIRPGTVKSRLFRARAALREAFQNTPVPTA